MESYDVIIVGAGPAGLNCAEKLAKAKLKVLLLEQNKIIGPKICAGGLTNKDLSYLNLPNKLLDCKYKEIKLYTSLNKTSVKNDNYLVYTIDRKTLGQWQLRKLKKTSVVVKTNSRVTKVEENKVTVNNSKIFKFKYLVGADGSSSIVRRHLGLKSKHVYIALQYIIPTRKYKNLEVFLDSKLFHSKYAWIFPHKNYVSIGCGCNTKFLSAKKLRENFHKWLKSNKIDVSKGEYQAYSTSSYFQGYKFGKIFLAGDAAGLVSAFTGEGIYQALISGEEIAKMIINRKYVSKKMEGLIKRKKLDNKLLHILERSGPFRKLEYELIAILLKSKLVAKKLIKLVE